MAGSSERHHRGRESANFSPRRTKAAPTASAAVVHAPDLPHTLMNLVGPRLKLRQWRDDDLESFAALNADAEVMQFFPQRFTRDQSLASLQKLKRNIDERGWGFWA